MATTLEVKLRTAASANAPLTALLGTSPFRWYDMQEAQGGTFPSVTVQMIAAVNQYSLTQRLNNSHNRVQFTVWDTDPERARSVELAVLNFLDGFNAYNAGDQNPRQRNEVVMRRQGGNPQTQPLTFWRILDAYIWHNETL